MTSLRIIEQGNNNFFLQMKIVSGSSVVINLTDMKKIWQTSLSESEVVQKFKDDNPLIHSSNKWIAEYVSTMIKNVSTNIKITVMEPDVNINFTSDVSSLSTKLNLLLLLQPSDMVYKEITLPLLMIISELKFREEKLLSVLKAKDTEIKEFKLEGATITRRNAITEPFNAINFDMECQSSLPKRGKDIINNPCSVFCPTLNSMYSEFSSVVANRDVREIKVESNSADSMNEDCKSEITRDTLKNKKVKKENELELKRKMTESLRTKRPKKSYKI